MKRFFCFFVIWFCILPFGAKAQLGNEQAFRASLITCYPGPVVYELYGHTAIRISHGEEDIAFNFGMFSFNKPNFIYRFVKGETDYALGAYPFSYFLPEYVNRNSKVVEQVLNLDEEQARFLYMRLMLLSLPENREYRYNYVLDNCATRPRDLIEQTVNGIEYPIPTDTTLTFRRMMHSFDKNYPWYGMGIDLALGPGIDYKLDARQQMFAPIYLMNAFANATFIDAQGNRIPLVKETNILFDGSESPIRPATPWFLSPSFFAWLLFAAAVWSVIHDIRRKKTARWFDTAWFTLTGLIGCLVFFLVFISVHEATSPNYLAFWLNPFCLFAAVATWIKSLGKWLYLYHFINFATVFVLAATWWMNPQTANAAFFPLMLCTMLRSANYIAIYKACAKKSK